MFREIGDRIFNRRFEYLDQNITIVIGEAGAVVVDTRASLRLADELREEMARITSAPLAAVINTHFHWDHSFGNSRFPNLPIHGHVRCRDALIADGASMRERVARTIGDGHGGEIGEVEIVPPDHVFTKEATIDLGDRSLHLSYHGRAHTDSDIVVSIDDAGISLMGDLIEEGAPPAFGDSYPAEWASTLSVIEPRLHEVVVPGHGAVVDRAFVANQRLELELVADIASADSGIGQVPSGPYPADVMKHVIERQRSLLGHDRRMS